MIKNKSGSAYEIITLDYKNSPAGKEQKRLDDMGTSHPSLALLIALALIHR
jgi:hypothetical protein